MESATFFGASAAVSVTVGGKEAWFSAAGLRESITGAVFSCSISSGDAAGKASGDAAAAWSDDMSVLGGLTEVGSMSVLGGLTGVGSASADQLSPRNSSYNGKKVAIND